MQKTAAEAARETGVDVSAVIAAKALRRDAAPEVTAAVEAGRLTLHSAKEIVATRRQHVRSPRRGSMELMDSATYAWADRIVGRAAVSIGALGGLLHVGRHQARRRLLASGLPFRVYRRTWTHPSGRIYARKAIAVPLESAEVLYRLRLIKEWNRNPFGLPDDPVPVPRVFLRKLNKALAAARKIPAGQLRAKS